jgi:acetylornithine aminotransferase
MKHIIWTNGHSLLFENIVGSDNCFLYDEAGKQYIDLESGVWCTSVGHNNKRVNKIITDQINKITHTGFCYTHPQLDQTAKRILEKCGIKLGKCEFLCSGSEAVELGLRIARAVAEKPMVLAFSDSYFGAYGDASVKNSEGWYLHNWLDCPCTKLGDACNGECEAFKNIPFEKIGIFLFEPGSSSGLVRFPPEKLLQKIIEKTKEHQIVVMVNEVTTGIGRTGKWFGYQHYNFVPDIVAIGKGIGNGYPVSITVISEKVASKLESVSFRYGQSHQNDPLGACVANEVISIIEEQGLLGKAEEFGNYLRTRLIGMKSEFPLIKTIRGRGLMLVIELKNSAQAVFEELLEQGFIVAKRPNAEVLRLDPALTIDKEIIDKFLDAFKGIVSKIV